MSGVNDPYDPKQVAALSDEALSGFVDAALHAFDSATDIAALKLAHTAHLGDKSPISLANREIAALPPTAKADAGKRVNGYRTRGRAAYEARLSVLQLQANERVLAEETVDVTLPWDRRLAGARHPLTTIQEKIADVFTSMGYDVAEGPEVEAEWFNFDALNIGPDHPARSMMDTFWVQPTDAEGAGGVQPTDAEGAGGVQRADAEGAGGVQRADAERAGGVQRADAERAGSGLVLRTHTSPVQARVMLTRTPPIYVICPGKVFRTDELDATHTPVFHQVEGLVIDKGITMAHLKGTLDHFAQAMFGAGVLSRLRPSYIPFTEPSAEPDLLCFVCHGDSVGNPDRPCRTCGSEGWIEWGGCGMVNPRVLRACGIDPDVYSGFAFGMGIERTMMFRNNAEDMRDMVEGDVRFTQAFGMEA
jgi:phenylalanyl-tRNA synthetase alpha chain